MEYLPVKRGRYNKERALTFQFQLRHQIMQQRIYTHDRAGCAPLRRYMSLPRSLGGCKDKIFFYSHGESVSKPEGAGELYFPTLITLANCYFGVYLPDHQNFLVVTVSNLQVPRALINSLVLMVKPTCGVAWHE